MSTSEGGDHLHMDEGLEGAAERGLVRLSQALLADEGHYWVLRTGAAALRIAGIATLAAAAVAAALVIGGSTDDTLGVPSWVAAAIVGTIGVLLALPQLILAELLTMQVLGAKRSRLETVVLAELNLTMAEMARRAANATPADQEVEPPRRRRTA